MRVCLCVLSLSLSSSFLWKYYLGLTSHWDVYKWVGCLREGRNHWHKYNCDFICKKRTKERKFVFNKRWKIWKQNNFHMLHKRLDSNNFVFLQILKDNVRLFCRSILLSVFLSPINYRMNAYPTFLVRFLYSLLTKKHSSPLFDHFIVGFQGAFDNWIIEKVYEVIVKDIS